MGNPPEADKWLMGRSDGKRGARPTIRRRPALCRQGTTRRPLGELERRYSEERDPCKKHIFCETNPRFTTRKCVWMSLRDR